MRHFSHDEMNVNSSPCLHIVCKRISNTFFSSFSSSLYLSFSLSSFPISRIHKLRFPIFHCKMYPHIVLVCGFSIVIPIAVCTLWMKIELVIIFVHSKFSRILFLAPVVPEDEIRKFLLGHRWNSLWWFDSNAYAENTKHKTESEGGKTLDRWWTLKRHRAQYTQ